MSVRDSFLKKRAARVEIVTIPVDYPDTELAGVRIAVKQMTALEHSVWNKQFANPDGSNNQASIDDLQYLMVVATAVDPDTLQPLFTAEDIPQLKEAPCDLIGPLVAVGFRLNRANSVEEHAKN